MTNIKLTRKSTMQMILSILVILFLMCFFTGGFVTTAGKKDIFSMEPHRILAESENWALSVPKNEERAPYFLYKGKADAGRTITITGIYPYQAEAGKSAVSENNAVEEIAVLDRHFLAGEKRWYLSVDSESINWEKTDLTLMWKSQNKTHSERLQSGAEPL